MQGLNRTVLFNIKVYTPPLNKSFLYTLIVIPVITGRNCFLTVLDLAVVCKEFTAHGQLGYGARTASLCYKSKKKERKRRRSILSSTNPESEKEQIQKEKISVSKRPTENPDPVENLWNESKRAVYRSFSRDVIGLKKKTILFCKEEWNKIAK